MSEFELSAGEALYYEYAPPRAKNITFVFVNALTGNTGTWQHAEIGPVLRAAGYGTLAWNFRGQVDTRYGAHTPLTPLGVVDDLVQLMARLAPPRPLLVGLSIGGLFAAQAILAGAQASALVLINTLRKPGVRLEWINQATAALARAGGTRLIMEAMLPQLVNSDMLAAARPSVFGAEPYQPIARDDGLYRLMEGSIAADWDVPWEQLALPVLVMTGHHDRVFRVAADIDELAARLPQVQRVEVANAGHLIPIERPAEFARAMLEFAGDLG